MLLPATMKLLGDWNWYLPRWLRWLPRLDVSESEPPAPAIADSPAPRRRRRRSLFVPAVVALLVGGAVAVAAMSPASLAAGIGGKSERPLRAAELERNYEFGIGDFTVDLRDVRLPSGTTKVDVELGIGNLLVRVPEHAALDIHAHADAGQVTVLSETDDGRGAEERAVVQGPTPAAPELELEADVGFGHLAIRRG